MKATEIGGASHENATKAPDTTLVFGQGPVIDARTMAKPTDATDPETVTVNLWSKNEAEAVAKLHEWGSVGEIVVLGGPTGGGRFKSEAELIKQEMVKAGVPAELIEEEKLSPDTIANLINIMNINHRNGRSVDSYQIVCARYHIVRVRALMQLFGLKVSNGFTSEDVLLYAARKERQDSTQWDNDALTELGRLTNPNDPTIFESKSGTEQRPYSDRAIKDNLWLRETFERPESWLGRLAELEDSQWRTFCLAQAEILYPGILSKYSIDLGKDTSDEVIQKLSMIQKNPLTPEEVDDWEHQNKNEGWTTSVEELVNAFIEARDVKVSEQEVLDYMQTKETHGLTKDQIYQLLQLIRSKVDHGIS